MNLSKTIKKILDANREVINSIIRSKKIYDNKSIDYENLYNEVHQNAAPCFVLSTGRCGTHLLTKLLSRHQKLDVHHTPNPELVYYSNYAYENYNKKSETIEKVFDAARYEYIRDAFLLDLQFVETNNRITFFANQISNVYPNAKFIHLVRNPLAFVKSGLNRSWYSGKSDHDEGRITLKSEDWEKYSTVQKIAWLWNATNVFIEDFKSSIDSEKVITIRSEDLFSDYKVAVSIFNFLSQQSLRKKEIEKIIGRPTNVSRTKSRKTDSQKIIDEIIPIIKLTSKYNYSV
ncbi:MAG: sulfotransferase [Melioribacteraceae bacterium]|nr:sulfotransferase [Melioribacteraceae bacterium]MCF8355561.1 sulfotransferase [Melioribacteraceae bacterium]MCF8394236.1 sulfotransferase [Melioribacteraceae bacterium]MCF8419957.1 sulfotransferase [Melioribacteraceae bacterium]